MLDKCWTGEYSPENMLKMINEYDPVLAGFLKKTMREAIELETIYENLDENIVGLICGIYDDLMADRND